MSQRPITAAEEPYLSIVIPAYNEAARLPTTLEKVAGYVKRQAESVEVILVDDGSDDGTADIAERFAASHAWARLLRTPHKGKGHAVRRGMLAARGKHVLFSDADLATPIERAADLVHCLNGKGDIAIGSREGLQARRIGEPAYRHVMGRAFNWVVRFFAISGIADTQCGFKCFKREVAQDLFRRVCLYGEDSPVVSGGMVTGFDVEVLFLARKTGYRIREVPVEWYHQPDSKVNPWRDSARMFRDVVRIRLNDWRGRYK